MRKVCLLALVAVTTMFAVPVAAAAINPDDQQSVLPSGHCLVTSHAYSVAELVSPSQRIRLSVDWFGSLQLDDHVEVPGAGGGGYPVWGFGAPDLTTRRATLCMQRNGDLVLRRAGRVAWRTRTAGKAPGGHAQVLDRGRFVVRTAHNKTVWSSHTTAVLMIAGDRLMPGQTLVNHTAPHSWTRLEMRRSGDLVLLRNHHVVWRTGTHTRSSYLLVTKTGRVDIMNPRHHVIWRSRAVGRHAVFTVAQRGRITLDNLPNGRCWHRPTWSDPDCGVG